TMGRKTLALGWAGAAILKELRLQPSSTLTMAKNSVFLIEMLLPKKQHVLKFLHKGHQLPVREARAVIFFGAQEHPNITEFAVGPLPRPHYMRHLPHKPRHQASWASRPISKAEYILLSHTLEEASKPLQQFFRRTTGFTTNPQDWTVEQVWYNGKFYRSPAELAQKYDDGEVDATKYMDVGWGLGSVTHELAPGVDCPETATFLDALHYYDADGPVLYPRALCLFEMPTGVLVLRTTSTVYNYDYIWDFIFYPNGVMEAKMHATGYVHATFYTPEGLRHGTRLHTHLIGNMHTHLVHYRVDLDMKLENTTNPWSPRHRLVQPALQETRYSRERQAAFSFRQTLPKYLLFTSPQENPWGHKRSYRLQIHSMADQVLPPGWQEERAVTWARYPLAVTRYRESELRSSSIYNQNDPWDPPVVFEEFLRNNENIEGKDIPNTATPGNSVGFLLRPFNFFPEDPSLASRDLVVVWPLENGSTYV
ncbi:hypothetical protein E2I00_013394, partial [Balaenoptera physalus]